MMVNVNNVYSSGNSLKAEDLQGRTVAVTISGVSIQQFEQNDRVQNKLVIAFQGKEKHLVCNVTNARRIEYMYGPETDNWIGKQIILGTEPVNFQGKIGPGLRVQMQQQSVPAALANAPMSHSHQQPMTLGQPTQQPEYGGPVEDLNDDVPF